MLGAVPIAVLALALGYAAPPIWRDARRFPVIWRDLRAAIERL